MAPEVSICIPAYRQPEQLERLLKSVESQQFSDFEIIVSDDSPGDEIKKCIEKFSFGNKLKYFYHSPSLGSPANWNFAFRQAKGTLVKIMHHDDFFTTSESLGKFVKMMHDHPHADFGFSATLIEFSGSKLTKTNRCKASQLKKIQSFPPSLFEKNVIGAPSACIFRRNAMQYFDEELKWLVDVDWYMQFLFKNKSLAYSPETLICTEHGGEEQTTQKVQRDKEIQLREHIYLFQKLNLDGKQQLKFSLLFQLLFHRYNVRSVSELSLYEKPDEKHKPFFEKALMEMKKNIFLKKINFWAGRNDMDDYLFMLKKKLK
ncbi:MAG: glycosyltransferase family 2 protein [Bacteroidota bacterium]